MVKAEEKKEPIWKASEVSTDDRKKVFTIAIVLTVLLVIILAVFIATLPPVRRIIYSDLRLDGVQARRINDEYVDENTTSTDLEIIIYLTNNGKLDSGEVRIDAYMRSFDTRGIETPCDSNDSITLGAILSDATGKTTLHFNDLEIRNDEQYTIDFYIWEDDKVVEKASTTIKVPYVEVKPEPQVDYSDDADSEPGRSKEEEEDKAIPGFEIVPLMLAIFTILILARVQWRILK